MRSGTASVLVILCLLLISGCSKPDTSFSDSVPTEYKPFLNNGQLVKRGDPTLDYWVHLNMHLFMANQRKNPTTPPPPGFDGRPSRLKHDAKVMRSYSTTGVDESLVKWAHRVANMFETQGNILGELDDLSAKPAKANQAALDRLDKASSEWQDECEQVRTEGRELRDSLSRRFNQSFPPCQF